MGEAFSTGEYSVEVPRLDRYVKRGKNELHITKGLMEELHEDLGVEYMVVQNIQQSLLSQLQWMELALLNALEYIQDLHPVTP